MEGNPYVGAIPTLLMVKPLAEPTATWDAGTAAFRAMIDAKREGSGVRDPA